ncbi:NAD(P)/FAD-dependent oxidoreductase [Kordiimonas pumila]|uniref:NAD(P)/FAD-dependent oxidoreductase n=1 Tax=Kordiimonas pumila TaxID=2161677 RepID=A0ABV7D4M6_9PROT|nr:FAD-dependent oxidoreductase [Kordiimonas pumila]
MGTVIIVGAGQAGMQTALKLREYGYESDITILGKEAHSAYERPPLSKSFLVNDDMEPVWVGSDEIKRNITLLTSCEVTAIRPDKKHITLSSGANIPYNYLVLATGGACRSLPLKTSAPIYNMRTIEDAQLLRKKMQSSKHMTILGAGVIGLEVAASARKCGIDVSIIELGTRVMGRNLPENFAPYIHAMHRENNIQFNMAESVIAISQSGQSYRVELQSGKSIQTDCIVSGIGITPNTQLAEAANLQVNNGIIVTQTMQTSDPSIFAVGDIATLYNEKFNTYERLESWENANKTAEIAAATICGAEIPAYKTPWFWSDQYDQNLQVLGWPLQADHTVFRKKDTSMLAIYLRGAELIGAVALNAGADISVLRRMMNACISPTLESLENPAVKLRSLLRA